VKYAPFGHKSVSIPRIPNRSTSALIDKAALRHNYRLIAGHAAGIPLMPMVKANAYGHGIIECSQVFLDEGAYALGVAFSTEAYLLRSNGISARIVIMTPPMPGDIPFIAAYGIETVICTIPALRMLDMHAASVNTTINVHVYIDTGMHRDGILPQDIPQFAAALKECTHIGIAGICTHLATADAEDTAFLDEQYAEFCKSLEIFRDMGIIFPMMHVFNSAGLLRRSADFPTGLLRPGLSLYGYSPLEEENTYSQQLKPALSLRSEILTIRRIKAGETVSYGRRYKALKDTSIATIPIGYGDGLFRSLGSALHCIIHGKKYSVAGTICMDECMIDIGDTPCQPGDEVIFIGHQGNEYISAADIAQMANTIPYEITTAISARVPRIYI
jgi:alanine racemase